MEDARLDRILSLLRREEWIIDGRESVSYCIWCKAPERRGHDDNCEVFGKAGLVTEMGYNPHSA